MKSVRVLPERQTAYDFEYEIDQEEDTNSFYDAEYTNQSLAEGIIDHTHGHGNNYYGLEIEEHSSTENHSEAPSSSSNPKKSFLSRWFSKVFHKTTNSLPSTNESNTNNITPEDFDVNIVATVGMTYDIGISSTTRSCCRPCICCYRSDDDLELVADSQKVTNERLLSIAFISFLFFTCLQFIAASTAHSKSMMGDAIAMAVDVFTYIFNIYAERKKISSNPSSNFVDDTDGRGMMSSVTVPVEKELDIQELKNTMATLERKVSSLNDQISIQEDNITSIKDALKEKEAQYEENIKNERIAKQLEMDAIDKKVKTIIQSKEIEIYSLSNRVIQAEDAIRSYQDLLSKLEAL